MQTNWLSKVLVVVALLPGSLANLAHAATPLTFTLVHEYLIVIPVSINGAPPAQFLLDTGTNTTLVTPEFARQLSLRPTGRVELLTVAGAQLVVQTQANTVAVGAHTVRGLEMLISDLGAVRQTVPQVSGVLGMNFLARFNYLLDYRARQLALEVDEAAYCGERLPFLFEEDRWFVLTREGAGARRYVLDSGIRLPLLFQPLAAFEVLPALPAHGQVRTDAGRRAIQQRRLRSLQLGRTRWTEVPVGFIPGEQRREDGLLPTSLCERIYFNHQQHYVILNPAR